MTEQCFLIHSKMPALWLHNFCFWCLTHQPGHSLLVNCVINNWHIQYYSISSSYLLILLYCVSCVFSVILSMTVNSLKLQATLCQSCSPPDRGLGLETDFLRSWSWSRHCRSWSWPRSRSIGLELVFKTTHVFAEPFHLVACFCQLIK